MFKLALNAGHGLNTPGKRCTKALDPNETREWWLNDRIADGIEEILAGYDGIEILRIDDTTGAKDISLASRTAKANEWGADLWFSLHHNASAKKIFDGGGIVAFVHTSPSDESVEWQKAFYDAVIDATGLKGNRATPIAKKNLAELRLTKMPAVLMECGFMDSSTDVPVILSKEFAEKCAKAFADVIIERAGLEKKAVLVPTETTYRVQVGSFSNKKYADNLLVKLGEKGYAGYIKTVTDNSETKYRVQVGAFRNKSYATALLAKLKKAGFSGYITT